MLMSFTRINIAGEGKMAWISDVLFKKGNITFQRIQKNCP